MERNEYLEALRAMADGGDTAGAVSGLLDVVAALMDEVDILNVQLETLLETLGGDEDQDDCFAGDECTYIIPCEQCGILLEVESELIDDEDAELSCPRCGAILEV